ncbi:LysM domain-containing protein [Megasphaera elsdenii]|uniref:LysM domain-containing protein n=1 Tax=Megasphaera elsdenii TaxID=907 RepID=UPI00242CB2E2|nr:LysM domain-containing protein [Megasphaera elsdenii]
MKVMSIYDEPETRRIPKRGPLFGAKSFLAMTVLACGIGLYTGMGMTGERVQADDVQVVTVETNQTVWDVARPIADAEGLDIREVVYQIQVNNNLDKDCTVIPGQQLVIRF